jgi:hypothetical protein
MLFIDRLRLRLPSGFEHRAADIAREVGQHLGTVDTAGLRSIDGLSVGPLQFGSSASDGEIAQTIAGAITDGLRRRA